MGPIANPFNRKKIKNNFVKKLFIQEINKKKFLI